MNQPDPSGRSAVTTKRGATPAPARPQPAGPSPAIQKALQLVDDVAQIARAHDREDLAARLSETRKLLVQPQILIYVVGEFKQGKSSLVNALLNADVCPVDDDISTAVPTAVQFGDKPRAWAITNNPEAPNTPRVDEIPVRELAAYTSESGNPGNERGLRMVTVGLPRKLLSGGLVLVDTPGVGGLGSVNSALTVTNLPRAHAMLLVSDASMELTESELQFLRIAREFCPTNALILTKTDLYAYWKRILQIDLEHLKRDGVKVSAAAVSSTLRKEALRRQDAGLDAESGFPGLIGLLRRLVGSAEKLALRSAALELSSAIGQLETALRAERDVLADPERAATITADLERAGQKADQMRERSARWQQVLFDGFADISSDVDFDMRQRTRSVLDDAEAAIDAGDPGKNWEEFENWLRRRLSGETLENYALLTRSAREVTARVAEYLELAEDEIRGPRAREAPLETISGIEAQTPTTKRRPLGEGLILARGLSSGVMMAMMVGRIGGMMLPGPAGLAVGLLMGGSGLGDEYRRRKEERRNKAKVAVRRFMDEYTLRVGKDSRDALRLSQRELRDQCMERVSELQRSVNQALDRAQHAQQVDRTTGKRDLERAQADLSRLASAGEEARRLSGGVARR